MLITITGVSLGSALGAVFRYAIIQLTKPLNQRLKLPLATLGINLIGAGLLGWVMTSPIPTLWQLFLGTGIMGGLTTFSTMINEIVLLIQSRHFTTASWYLGLSLIGGLTMVWLGTLL